MRLTQSSGQSTAFLFLGELSQERENRGGWEKEGYKAAWETEAVALIITSGHVKTLKGCCGFWNTKS